MGVRPLQYEDRGLLKNFLTYLDYFKKYKSRAFWTVMFYLFKYIPFASYPIVVKLVVDTYIPAGDTGKIYSSIFIIAVFGLSNIIFHTAFETSRMEIVKNISRDIRNTLIDRLQVLSLTFHSKAESGRLYSKIMVDTNKIEQFSDVIFHGFLAVAVSFTYSVIILSLVNVKIMLLLLLLMPLFFIIQQAFKNTLRKLQYIGRITNEDLSQTVTTFLQTSMLVRVHGEEKFEQAKIDDKSKTVIMRYKDIVFKLAMFGATNTVTTQIFQFALVIVLAAAVIQKKVLIGEMFLFINFANTIIGNVSQIVNQYNMVLEFSESMNSIHEVLNAKELELNEGKKKVAALRGDIVFDNVSFSFNPQTPILRDISVKIDHGATVALVGASGAGKTTFANMVLGLYRPTSGSVLLDGTSVNDLDMRSVRQFVGMVTQEAILFSGTIEDNICHARKVNTSYEIMEAAKKANAHDFIMQLPDRYKTLVGERGATLSGGQRQRIAIARAIMREPSILLLDEATSALDAESEEEIRKAIEHMLGKQTTIIIAHRLSTVMNADRIFVFKDGRIVEAGNHKELIALKGDYAKLVSIQLRIDIDELTGTKGRKEKKA